MSAISASSLILRSPADVESELRLLLADDRQSWQQTSASQKESGCWWRALPTVLADQARARRESFPAVCPSRLLQRDRMMQRDAGLQARGASRRHHPFGEDPRRRCFACGRRSRVQAASHPSPVRGRRGWRSSSTCRPCPCHRQDRRAPCWRQALPPGSLR